MAVKSKQQYIATLIRLHQELGAEVMFTMPDPPPPLSTLARAQQRARTSDTFDGYANFPPASTRSQCAFVYDYAFGPEQDLPERARWADRAAKLFRSAIAQAGFDRDQCSFISLWRGGVPTTGDKPAAHVPIDLPGLDSALSAADTSHVVLVGRTATTAWHPHVTLDHVAGRTGAWHSRWVTATYHPNAVFRDLVTAETWRQHFARFRQQIDDLPGEAGDARWMLDPTCAACGGELAMFDQYGIAWCDQHLDAVRKAYTLKKKGLARQGVLVLD